VSIGAVELTGNEGGSGHPEPALGANDRAGDGGIPYEPSWLPTLFDLDDLLDVLDIRIGTPPLVLRCLDSSHGGILGAQLVAQQVVLAERLVPGKRVRASSTLFTRPGRNDRVLEVDVEKLHSGLGFATLTTSFRQGGELVCRGQVLLSDGEADIANTRVAVPASVPPEASRHVRRALIPWEARDLPDENSPHAELWMRAPALIGDDPTMWSALLAHASMVPALSHQPAGGSGTSTSSGVEPDEVEPVVRSHSLTFVTGMDTREWHLMRTWSHCAGSGRWTCHGEFHSPSGHLGALFATVGLPD
jgi:acyl-CoA thioesterase-2